MVLNEVLGDPLEKCTPMKLNRMGHSILGVSMT